MEFSSLDAAIVRQFFLVHVIWSVGVLVVYAGTHLLRMNDPRARYNLLWASYVIVLPAAAVQQFVMPWLRQTLPAQTVPLPTIAPPLMPAAVGAPARWELAGVIVLGTVAVGLMYFAIQALAVWRSRRRLRSCADERVLRELDLLRDELRLDREVRCLVTDSPSPPCSLGIRRPAVVLGIEWVAAVPTERLRHVLAHELIHIRCHDYSRNLLQKLTRSVLLLNPLAFWLDARLDEWREVACDREVLELGQFDRRAYATTLLDMGVGLQAAWIDGARIPFLRRGSNLKRRVYHMKGVSTKDATIKAVMLASVVFLVFGFIACSDTEEPAGPDVSSTVESAADAHKTGESPILVLHSEEGDLTLEQILEAHPELSDEHNVFFSEDSKVFVDTDMSLSELLETHNVENLEDGEVVWFDDEGLHEAGDGEVHGTWVLDKDAESDDDDDQ